MLGALSKEKLVCDITMFFMCEEAFYLCRGCLL